MRLDDVRELKAQWRHQVSTWALRGIDDASPRALPHGVLAVGIAPGTAPGDYRLALRYGVASPHTLQQVDQWVQRAHGQAQVRQVGLLRPLHAAPWQRMVQRPLRIGVSVAHCRSTAGTLGAFVRQAALPGALLALSNSHVLALEGQGAVGDAVLQPGPHDGGQPAHQVATLHAHVPLLHGRPNLVDAAVAQVLPSYLPHQPGLIPGLAPLRGLATQPCELMPWVAKVGRTTGLTRGRVTAIEVDQLPVNYDIGVLQFDGQIEIEGLGDAPFAQPGDSGALVVGPDGDAVGLLFCGSSHGGSRDEGLAYAHPLDAVLSALNVQLAT